MFLVQNSVKKRMWVFFFIFVISNFLLLLPFECNVFVQKLARGDRPHIFTGVKPLKTFFILLHWGELFQGSYSLKFEPWYSLYIADQDTARYSLCSARENCVSWAEPLKHNRQFVQFARIPVEFVARLWDLSTQKYNNFSIAAVILGYLLLISP